MPKKEIWCFHDYSNICEPTKVTHETVTVELISPGVPSSVPVGGNFFTEFILSNTILAAMSEWSILGKTWLTFPTLCYCEKLERLTSKLCGTPAVDRVSYVLLSRHDDWKYNQ